MRETTEIRIDEHGSETHESWISVRAGKISGLTHLFNSEIQHQHWVRVEVTRMTRSRDHNRDWLHPTGKRIIEFDLSEAQWGAFVSSFGTSGVPATLVSLNGLLVPEAPHESRLDHSHKEVRESGRIALEKIACAQQAVQEAFDRNAGKKEMREKLSNLQSAVNNGPSNMEFAAKSLTEHVENVITKAKFDIEAGALQANRDLEAKDLDILGPGV